MCPRNPPVGHRTDARTVVAAAALLIVGLTGCALELTSRSTRPSADPVPYVGVFTGAFVEGKPLYRFPTIEVVGSRSGAESGI